MAIQDSTTDNRFTKRSRLSDGDAYGRVFKNAKRSRDKIFTVLYSVNEKTDNGNARLGLAISKKHCKLASGRNRIKRLIRESFRTHRADLADLDIVVINQPAAARAANSMISNSLERHWQQCKEGAKREAGKN